jgi:hypothetical protein
MANYGKDVRFVAKLRGVPPSGSGMFPAPPIRQRLSERPGYGPTTSVFVILVTSVNTWVASVIPVAAVSAISSVSVAVASGLGRRYAALERCLSAVARGALPGRVRRGRAAGRPRDRREGVV